MQVIELKYRNHAVKKLCTNLKVSQKKLGRRTAEALFGLVTLLESAPNLEDVNALQSRRIHGLTGNRQGQYALDIDGRANSYRLIILLLDDEENTVTNIANDSVASFYSKIQIVQIEEVSKHYA